MSNSDEFVSFISPTLLGPNRIERALFSETPRPDAEDTNAEQPDPHGLMAELRAYQQDVYREDNAS